MANHGIIHKYFRNLTIEPRGQLRKLLLDENMASKGNICSMFIICGLKNKQINKQKTVENQSNVEHQKNVLELISALLFAG